MAHSGGLHGSRLPGFAHFESSLSVSSPLCSFEQLDLRFGEDVGLPNTGLDLSCVNGLDLSSASYEGLNLSQQCLNLSSTGGRGGAQTSQNNQKQQQQQQNNGFPTQPEMVLNLSTQIGLNLTRPSVLGYPTLEQVQGLADTFDPSGAQEGGGFSYYGDYSSYSGYPAATSTLCNMEEQRCSPLNLERRSSPLNLAVVGGRKRKPTPGQAQPVNMVGKVMGGQASYSQQQEFACNNHMQPYDYRIPNKLTAFYSQQEGPEVKRQAGGKQEQKAVVAQEYQGDLAAELAHHGSGELFFPELEFQQEAVTFPQELHLLPTSGKGATYRKEGERSQRTKAPGGSLGKLQQGKGRPGVGKVLQEQEGAEAMPQPSYPFSDTSYSELNYSYTDALNFATEALNANTNSPHKAFTEFGGHSEQPGDRTAGMAKPSSSNAQALNPSLNKMRLFCSSCSLEFASSSDLNKHMDSHNKALSEPKYSCSQCKLGFIEESQLLTHNKLHHEVVKAKTSVTSTADNCLKPKNLTTKKTETLTKTNKEHTAKYEVKIKSQEEIQRLKDEMAREPFPYQCVTCSKKFAERTELLQHMEDHNAMKPFKCEVCDLGFTYMSAKKRHEKTHSSDKAFQCKDCTKAFHRKSDLTTHARSHSRARQRHSCEQCGQMFPTEHRLKEHRCSAKPSKQLKCEMCPKVLATKVEWGVHMWRHTKNSSYILTSESDPLPRLATGGLVDSVDTINQPINMQVVH